jgi:PTS system mannose-specific IIA component
MIGIVIVAHNHLAQEFLNTLEHVMGGPQENILALSFSGDGAIEEDKKALSRAMEEVDQGHGIVILTDMFGGSPSNMAISHLKPGFVEVIAGVNLPLLIKLASLRSSHGLVDAVNMAQEAGKSYIHVASNLLKSLDT